MNLLLPTTRFIPRSGLPDRVQVAEAAIEEILERHGLKFALRCATVKGQTVHAELVLIDRED